ncbi:MAG: aminoacetone oxidase family FAD-binding enzyme [Marinilabiliales bacterium]|nr:MAG: aminoacetone oxidase family FAD-binding enzyme [Marinilabiliales bacterium]
MTSGVFPKFFLFLLQIGIMDNFDVIIIGAGASGLVAAIKASEYGQKVAVLEKMSIPGKKLLITGKGRCNITNDSDIREFIDQVYPDGRILFSVFKQFFSYDILSLLSEEGVEVKLERGGRYFPESDKASDVVDALYNRALRQNVKFLYNANVNKILYESGDVRGVEFLQNNKINILHSEKVIVCTGGKSYPGTGSTGDGFRLAMEAGHTINEPYPALVPLVTEDWRARDMQGLSLKNVEAKLIINDKEDRSEFGEMLFTHYGLSGPVILTLSRDVVLALDKKNKVEVEIDWKPALDEAKLDKRLIRDINERGKLKVVNIFKGWLPQKAIPVFINSIGLDSEKPSNQISSDERNRIINELKKMRFRINGHRGFKEAIVTAGGVSLDEINQKTMESKLRKGLFFAGEVLNLDANTGGYNLQIAFSTAYVAAS